MTTAVELDLYDLDLTTKLAILPAVDVGLYFELNQPGSGECKVHTLRSVASGLLQQGQFVRVRYRDAVQGGFFVEDIGKVEASQGESADLWTPIQGRGPMKLLESAMVWSDGTEASTRDFDEQPKAAMLITLIEEAKARGGLPVVGYDFTASVDSDGNAWTDAEPMQFSVGKTLLEVCREISDFGIDTNMTVNEDGTFTLQAFANGRGTDKSSTIYFRRGINCTEVNVDGRGMDFTNVLLLKHDGGYVTVKDDASIAAYGRHERLIDAHDAGNSANAQSYGQALLDVKKAPKKEISVQMYDGVWPYVFADYNVGDWITKDSSGVTEQLRVRSIQLNWQDAEKADVTVGLSTLVMENEVKQNNDIRKLYEMIRRQNDGKETRLPFWAAIGKLSTLATEGTEIYAMAVSAAGYLYVGGAITKIGGVNVGNAARYNIKTGEWATLGTGFDEAVYAIDVDGTNVYFGGMFSTADGVTCAGSLARWDEDTESFTAVTTGANPIYPIRCIAVAGGRVYVGGTNDAPVIGGDYACVGFINTTDDSWNEMPGIIGEATMDANSIDVSEDKVYVGFGQSNNGVILYSWDIVGETWSEHATNYFPLGGNIYAVKIHNGYLYIGGDFEKLVTPSPELADIANTTAIARMNLDTEVIESFEGGMPSTDDVIHAFVVSGSDLIIGGLFAEIGTLAANNIAKWNGGTFDLLTTGLDGKCNALVEYNGNIGAGGVFTHAGGKPIKYLGAYITSLEELANYLETGGGANSSGYTHPDHAGDVASVGDGATTIQPNAVDNTKAADMPAGTVKANPELTSGDPQDVTFEDLLALLGIVPGTQTAKRVLISDASGAISTSDYVAYDDATKILTMGEAIVGYVQSVIWNLSSNISRVLNMITWGAGNSSRFKGTFARGTIDAATAAQSGDTLSRFSGAGYDGVTSIQNAATSAELRVEAAENFDSTHHGTNIGVWITLPGTTTMVRVGTFTDAGLNLEAGYEYLVDGIPVGGGGTNSLQIDCSGGTSDTYGALSGTINGSNKVFTVSLGSYVSGGLQLYLNGQLLTQGTSEDWTETSPTSGTFTLTNAPISGDVLMVVYKRSATTSGNADTLDGYEAETLLNMPRAGRGTVEVDFGVGNLYKTVNVFDALATTTSMIVANVSCQPTTNNTADDIMVQPMEVKVGGRGTGDFDITVLSLLGKVVGRVNVDYILMN